MKLFLARHGETDWLLQGRLQGRSKVSLNETGKKQAKAAAAYLSAAGAGRLFVSELDRAKETARYISEACGIRPQTDARLNEIYFGKWEGETYDTIRAQYPEHFKNWIELKPDFSAPGGENVREVSRRIMSFCDEWSPVDESVIAVSHGGPIRLLLLELLNEPLCKFRSVPVEPGSITLIEQAEGGMKIVKIDPATGAETCLRSILRGELLDAG